MSASATPASLQQIVAALGGEVGVGARPVERWNPPYCGEIDLRIARDGTWHYQGSPIRRPALVKLFASILRRDPERHVLVTPVERVGIEVEDAPFVAVAMAADGEGSARRMHVRTNVDDVVEVGPDHPLRFVVEADGAFKPYLRVRGDLWALFSRPLAQEIALLADGGDQLGIHAGGVFFPLPVQDELDPSA